MRRGWLVVVLGSSAGLILLLVLAQSTRAQLTEDPTLERGLKAYGAFEGGSIDSIGMTNGNLNLHIPLVSYPQRGGELHFGFYVKYDNNSYVHIPSTSPDCTTRPFVCEYGDSVGVPGMAIVPDMGLTSMSPAVSRPRSGPTPRSKQ